MKTVALIPLRGGSKSIRYKNIRPIAGEPLCYWVLKAATEANCIDEVYVSTEDPVIKEAVESLKMGVKVIDRPQEFATDLATTDSVMVHFSSAVPNFDILFTIQATSPLTTAEDIETAFKQFQEQNLDSMFTAVRIKRFFWSDDYNPLNYDYLNRPMRQQFKGTLMENGAFYITKKELLQNGKEQNRLGGKIGAYEMPEEYIAELDEPWDWPAVETLLLKRMK